MKPEGQFDLDQFLTDMVYDMPPDLVRSVQDYVRNFDPFSLADFKITFVLDTTILFSAVRTKVLHGKVTLLEKLTKNPNLRICAPPHLEEEIMAKISKKFPKNKKTRNIEIDDAHEAAKEILNKIEIIDSVDSESLKKANVSLANRDPDDVPFLALCFSAGASGIITNDKDFAEDDSVRIWKTNEIGEVVTVLNKGTLCLAVRTASLSLAARLAEEILSAIWATVISLIVNGLGLIKRGAKLVMDHPWISALIAPGLIIFEAQTGCIRAITKKCLERLQGIKEALWDLSQFFGEVSGNAFVGLSVLTSSYDQACIEMKKLQESR